MLIVLVDRRSEKPVRNIVQSGDPRPAIQVGDAMLPVVFSRGGATIVAHDGEHRIVAGTAKVFWTGGRRVSAWIQ
jgi:hypothetical protein